MNKETRSRIMKGVKSKGNKTTEKRFRASLVSKRVKGWRMNDKGVFGTPDFAFEEKKIAIFLDGCFWHGCPKCYRRPKSSQKYWDAKVKRNIKHDNEVNRKLRKSGWAVVRIWEHVLKKSNAPIYLLIQDFLIAPLKNKKFCIIN